MKRILLVSISVFGVISGCLAYGIYRYGDSYYKDCEGHPLTDPERCMDLIDDPSIPLDVKAELCGQWRYSKRCEATTVAFAEQVIRDGDPESGNHCHHALKALAHADTAHRHAEVLSRLRGKCCPLNYTTGDKELCAAGLTAGGE